MRWGSKGLDCSWTPYCPFCAPWMSIERHLEKGMSSLPHSHPWPRLDSFKSLLSLPFPPTLLSPETGEDSVNPEEDEESLFPLWASHSAPGPPTGPRITGPIGKQSPS